MSTSHSGKSLLIMRHAKSSWRDSGLSDHARPLNGRGKRDAPRIGRLLKERDLIPDQILSSTAERAQSTARLVAKSCGIEDRLEYLPDLYLASPRDHIEVLQQLDIAQLVLVIAHNPGVESLAAELSGTAIEFPTAAVAHIDLDVREWSDLSLDTPGTLREMWKPREL